MNPAFLKYYISTIKGIAIKNTIESTNTRIAANTPSTLNTIPPIARPHLEDFRPIIPRINPTTPRIILNIGSKAVQNERIPKISAAIANPFYHFGVVFVLVDLV